MASGGMCSGGNGDFRRRKDTDHGCGTVSDQPRTSHRGSGAAKLATELVHERSAACWWRSCHALFALCRCCLRLFFVL